MKRTWTITLLKHEQPSEDAWHEIDRFVATWNERHALRFTSMMEFMWHLNFDDGTKLEMDQLIQEIDTLKRKTKLVYHVSSRGTLEQSDYDKADFIQVTGTGIGTSSRPFILNQEEVIIPASPCPECGHQDIFDSLQRKSLVIDESQLDLEIENEPPPGRDGWDLIELPTGRMLVSRRLASLLENEEVEGYNLVEVIDSVTGRASERVFQIIAKKTVLTPCIDHSRIKGDSFCPDCGTAYSDLEGYFWIRSDWIGDDEVISRHPSGAVMLYVSRRAYELLISAGFSGIHRNDVLFVCHH